MLRLIKLISKRRISGMALLILEVLQMIFIMFSLILIRACCLLVHKLRENHRDVASTIGATTKDFSNVFTNATSGVFYYFHGIDKAVDDTWNNFWKVGKVVFFKQKTAYEMLP